MRPSVSEVHRLYRTKHGIHPHHVPRKNEEKASSAHLKCPQASVETTADAVGAQHGGEGAELALATIACWVTPSRARGQSLVPAAMS